MSLARWLKWVVLPLIVVGLGGLFAVQNGERRSDLSLDLGFAAWHLREPAPIPAIVGVALAVGLVVGLVLGLALRGRPAAPPPSDWT